MTITIRHAGNTLIGLGIIIGAVLAVKVHDGTPHSSAFILWSTIAATLAICGTIACAVDTIATRITTHITRTYWRQQINEYTDADVRDISDARNNRTRNGRTAN